MTRRTLLSLAPLAPLAASSHAPVKLILHADDYGVSHSTNAAISEMLAAGTISSASIMMPCAWAAEAAAFARENPKLDIGVHLTLTSEWKGLRWGPVAPADKVKGLLDPHGYMWPSVQSVAMSATAEELAIEMRAQIEKAKKMGIRFTHLDTHMGTVYARPDFFEAYWRLGAEYGVPVMLMKPGKLAKVQGSPLMVKHLLSQEERFQKEGRFRLDTLITGPARGGNTLEERRDSYIEAITALGPGVHQLILHPAKLDNELKAMTGSAVARDRDYRIFHDPKMKGWWADKGIALVGWQDVAPNG
ncbi:MAG: polysaccharide deacetylase family protein [Bryobacteraceae bacterium]|nr:polysaccharide deacetylase family protein [Bryobacteraceae bacterium]